jgi:hypothetical protein
VAFEPGSKLARIEASAFAHCYALASLSLPASVEILAAGCFAASGIETLRIEMGSKLCQVGEHVFSGCSRLRFLYLPESVMFVPGQTAFQQVRTVGSQIVLYVRICSSRVPLFSQIFDHSVGLGGEDFVEGYDQCLADLTDDI